MPDINPELCNCRIIHEDRIQSAQDSALPPQEVEQSVQFLKAMADNSRFRILWALNDDEMCVCDLAALLGITESAVSHQLRLLRNLRLVSNRRQGPVLYYRLNDDHIGQLLDVVLQHNRE